MLLVRFLSLLVLTMLPAVGVAQHADLTPLQLDTSKNQYLHGHSQSWITTDQSVTLKDLVLGYNPGFNSTRSYLGSSRKNIWYRSTLHNPSSEQLTYFLNFDDLLIEEIELGYLQHGEIKRWQTGLKYPWRSRAINYRYYAFPVTLASQESLTIYYRINSHLHETINPFLIPSEQFPHYVEQHAITTLVAVGILIGLLIFMLFITLVVLRGTIPWSYSGFVISASLMIAYNNGAIISLMPEAGGLQYRLFPIFAALLIAFQTRFIQVTFLSSKLSPLLYRSYHIFITIPLLCAIPVAVWAPGIGLLLTGPIALLLVLLFVLSTLRAYAIKMPYRGLLLLTTSLGLLPVAAMIANNYPLLAVPLGLNKAFSLSWASQAVVMSLVTTLKLNIFKQQAEQSRQQVVIAEAEQRAAQEFLAKMSHEIRTPINGVIGMSELLSKTDLATEQKYYNNIVLGSGKLLLSIIDDVLDYSKLSAGAMSIEQTEFNLADILCETCMLFTRQAGQKKLSIPLRIDPQIPVALIGDPFRLKQVIANLLSNGIKFTDEGSVSLTVTEVRQDEQEVRLLFRIEDTGIGITEELHRQLFEAFTQASKGTSRKYGGTGLGLPISAQLVQLMGGELKIRSQENQGSCFYFECSFAIDKTGEHERLKTIKPLRQYQLILATKIPVFIEAYREYFEYFGIDCHYANSLTQLINNPAELEQADLLITEFYTAAANNEQFIDLQQRCSLPIALLQPLQFIESPLNLGRASTLIVPCPFHQLAYFMCQLIEDEGSAVNTQNANDDTGLAANKKLLVAEDNLVNQQVIGALLKKLGLQFQLANNGQEALNLYQQQHSGFDLVLMDCEMPEMDGYTASQAIREFERQHQLPETPIVALTANVMSSAKQQCMDSGMNAVLTKPIRFDELKQGLQDALTRAIK